MAKPKCLSKKGKRAKPYNPRSQEAIEHRARTIAAYAALQFKAEQGYMPLNPQAFPGQPWKQNEQDAQLAAAAIQLFK